MNITIHNTSKIVHINDVPARVWEGETDTGIKVHAFITRIMVAKDEDCTQFEKELSEQPPPSPAMQGFPLNLIV